jgi:hypothetical protein
VDGTLIAAQEITGPQHSCLEVVGSNVWVRMVDQNGLSTGVTAGAAPPVNTPAVATLYHSGGVSPLLKGRVDGVGDASSVSTTSLVASNFGAASLGYGYWNYFPQQAIQGYVFGGIMGAGTPTQAELGVMEAYLRTFAVTPVVLSGYEALIQAQFDAPNNNGGFWGRLTSVSNFWNSATDHTHPAGFGTTGSPVGAMVWINSGNPINGHDAVETNNLQSPLLVDDGSGHNVYEVYQGTEVAGAGAASTAFHFIAVMKDTTYEGVIASDMTSANHGWRLRYSGNTDKFYLDIGLGSSTFTLELPTPWAGTFSAPKGGNAGATAGGNFTIEAKYDGTNAGLRYNKSATYVASQAVGAPMVAGGPNLMIGSDYPKGTTLSVLYLHELMFTKNFTFSAGNADTINTGMGALAGLTI